MENYSLRDESFPAGLRVLVVDDDPTWLKILEKMLRKCSYEVTTCGLARVALDMLRERRNRFDIVISDVNMPDMDGFKLLEQVGLEMDLPVIMMSVDGETSRVMKGVQHGACDYLLKPVRMKELRNIWQHVFRKKINEVREIETYEGYEDNYNSMRGRLDEFDEKLGFNGGGFLNSSKKRKESSIEQSLGDSGSVKKARIVWSVDLHQKFVNAVNQIGFDKVGPKKILDLMDVPGLTRENVASHLQKYRLYLSRLQKQEQEKSQTDVKGKDPFVQLTQQKNSKTEYEFSSGRIYTHDVISPKKASFVQAKTGSMLTNETRMSPKKGDITQLIKFMHAGQNGHFNGKVLEIEPVDSKESKHTKIWKYGVDLVNTQVNHTPSINACPFQQTHSGNDPLYSFDKKKSISSWSTLTSTEAAAAQSVNVDSLNFSLESNGFSENTSQDLQRFLYDELQYNCEYLFDFYEAPMVDDGLFT